MAEWSEVFVFVALGPPAPSQHHIRRDIREMMFLFLPENMMWYSSEANLALLINNHNICWWRNKNTVLLTFFGWKKSSLSGTKNKLLLHPGPAE